MAVNATTIATALKTLYDDALAGTVDQDQFADQMGIIIKDAILSADVAVTTPGVQAGGATLPGTGGLT